MGNLEFCPKCGKLLLPKKEGRKTLLKCKNCGAPRLEEMQYDNCLFCGSKLFETA